ncbi:MAG: hypothetical protein QOC95_2695 [Thermoleophilaceae bacterium]|nr:hypothetical protein [Thermoleophilaceae bacterium]
MRGPARSATALAATGLIALAGCGEKRETTTGAGATAGSSAAPGSLSVSETEFKLTPSSPKVAKAGTVSIQVKNDGTTQHALEVVAPGGEVKTAPIAPGKNATLKVNLSKAGTYQWYCPIDGHRGMGMKGQIVVAGGGSGGSKPSGSGGSQNGGGGRYGGGY